jgi:hypothetical protein
VLYLTSQRTKLSDFWCFGVLVINKEIIAKIMEQKKQVVGEICKLMCHSPWKAPI